MPRITGNLINAYYVCKRKLRIYAHEIAPLQNMRLEDKKREALKKFVTKLKERLGDKIWGIYLFGSLAKGTATEESDIDILIVYSDFEERSLLEVVSEIGYKILMETGELIEAILMLKEEYESSLGKSPFLWEVLQFGTPLFTRLKGTEWELEFKDKLAQGFILIARKELEGNP